MEIYKITNLVNGKKYIGQTIKTFNDRYNFAGEGVERVWAYLNFRRDKETFYQTRMYHNNHLLKAIEKYGFDNFAVDIIDTAETSEELNQKECYWIEHYNAFTDGYNYCIGGNGTRGYKFSEEAKRKMSLSRKGVHAGDKNPNYKARHFTEETIRKMSIAKKGKYTGTDSWRSVKIINLDTLEVFDTITQAGEKYGIKNSNISHCCQRKERGKHGVRTRAGGYRWMYYDEYLEKGDVVGFPTNKRHKKVINIDTNEIFDTATQAGKHYSIDPSQIGKVCKGKLKTCGGFRWEYYN